MLAVMTKKGGYLVKVNDSYGCYTDKDGIFIRSVRDSIAEELEWAKGNWAQYKEEEFPTDKETSLLKELAYIPEYKNSSIPA